MAGYYAIADPAEPVRTDLDNELEGMSCRRPAFSCSVRTFIDARWYTREEVLAVLTHSDGAAAKQAPKWDSGVEDTAQHEEVVITQTQNEPPFKGPPPNAMAGVLISDWAHGRVSLSEKQDGDLV